MSHSTLTIYMEAICIPVAVVVVLAIVTSLEDKCYLHCEKSMNFILFLFWKEMRLAPMIVAITFPTL